jgi:ubiquinone biosynthesis protein UbiJ
MRLPAICEPLNHILRANSWALERLRPHAGRVVCVDNPPFSFVIVVTASGEAADAGKDAVPDVTVRVTPGLMLRVLARDTSAWNEVKVEGNVEFASALSHVARHLRWDVEEDLSRVFGDIAAHRMVETGRKIGDWGRQGADNLARSFTEYWTEERPLIASRDDIEQFNRDVDALRDDVSRLEKRIELCEGVKK